LQHVLVAQAGGDLEHLNLLRFHQHLHDAVMVAQVDEADPAEVAGDVGPAAQSDGLAGQGLVDEAAEMGTHGELRKRFRRRTGRTARHFDAGGRSGQIRSLIGPE
jgi:hypothetical protein